MTVMRNSLAATAVLGALALFSPRAYAADPCQLEISGNDQIQYDKKELSAPASCKQITVTLHHSGKLPKEAMGHDWVLVSAADLAAVVQAGMGAGAQSGYVPAGDKRVLANTKLIGGGESTSVTFASSVLKAGGAYKYVCTFPGHSALMVGDFKFQ